MFEGRLTARSGDGLYEAGNRRDCSLWVDSSNGAFGNDIIQTYNGFFPHPCLESQLWMDRSTGFGPSHPEKADDAGLLGTRNCNDAAAFSRHIRGRKRSPHGSADLPQKPRAQYGIPGECSPLFLPIFVRVERTLRRRRRPEARIESCR